MGNTIVRLTSGDLFTADQIIDKLKTGDAQMVKIFWEQLTSGGAAALATISAAKTLDMPNRDTKLIPGLDSGDKRVRNATLNALKGVDKKVVNQAIRKVMDEDPESDLRSLAASLLATSKDPEFAASARFHALRSDDSKWFWPRLKNSQTAKPKKRLADL